MPHRSADVTEQDNDGWWSESVEKLNSTTGNRRLQEMEAHLQKHVFFPFELGQMTSSPIVTSDQCETSHCCF